MTHICLKLSGMHPEYPRLCMLDVDSSTTTGADAGFWRGGGPI